MDHVLSFCTILQKFRLMILFHDEVWSGKLGIVRCSKYKNFGNWKLLLILEKMIKLINSIYYL